MVGFVRRWAMAIAVASIVINVVILVSSCVIWVLAIQRGWLDSVVFVSHVSMLALVFTGVSGVASAVAGVLAVVPTDDLVD